MRTLLAFLCLTVALAVGCARSSPHRDRDANEIVWIEEGIVHDDAVIDLGYRIPAKGLRSIDPVAKITRNGTPVVDALVFNVLVAANGADVIGEERATAYEESSDSAYYAQGVLDVPQDASQCTVRFRVVLPDGAVSWTRDVLVKLM